MILIVNDKIVNDFALQNYTFHSTNPITPLIIYFCFFKKFTCCINCTFIPYIYTAGIVQYPLFCGFQCNKS